jgi:hypothetical protein
MDNNKQQIQTAGIMAAIKGYLDDRAAGKTHRIIVGRARAGDRATRVYRAGRACSRCGDDSTGPSQSGQQIRDQDPIEPPAC